ncbi:DUF6624 domain-containing protein [Streptomyces sp. NPDC056244]|uniref:DUF6624 domain-containing protein n=1 Tax=unclassified Streptomyces TaxID=2593676 RepID=UPI0035DEF460
MSASRPSQPQIALTLLDLKRRHQAAQEQAAPPAHEADQIALREVEDKATGTLRQVIAAHGWPGRSLVGEIGAAAAWWIAQHATANPEFQQHALALVEGAVHVGEATPQQLAYLTDRCRIIAGQPQLYGTQFSYIQTGTPVPYAVDDPDELDARRAEMGLEPFDVFEVLIRTLYPPLEPPTAESTAC